MKTVNVAMAFIFVVCLAAPLAACGGGGGEETATPASTATVVATSTPSPAPTPTPVPPEVEEQLRQMVLPLEHLPSGVILAEEYFSTNEESAAAASDSAGRLAKLEEWGRILGYEVTYQANPEVSSQTGLMLADSSVSLYSSEEGATASFADAVETARATDWGAIFGGAQDVESEELPSPGWVDEMLWLRIKAKATAEEGEEETFVQDVILLRQGPGRATLMVGWIMGTGSGDIAAQLAQAQAECLKNVLP
jgi:hypothetical protein